MCGIAGVVMKEGRVDPGLLTRQRDSMHHRGPDDAGLWCSPDGRVGLAHRRLSIVDLSVQGRQPMASADADVRIVFNGEIYNFRELRSELAQSGVTFATGTDTEVIIQSYRRWGHQCLQRFIGMFAFGLWDGGRQELFLARDRAGEKPLFYTEARGRLSFASELKALMLDPVLDRVIDPAALHSYFAFGYVPSEMSILRGVRKLPAAHACVYDARSGTTRTWRYWGLPESPVPETVDEEQLVDELESLLADAVERQLVADVPVGILLSGGIDSSLVAALAARSSSRPVKTFTVGFPGHAAHDETPYARRVADFYSTEHTELMAEPMTVDVLPELARQYDEPLADSSMLPTYLVSRLIRQHATVALGGDGGDELFGGYTSYAGMLRQNHVRGLIPWPVRQMMGSAAKHVLPRGFKGRNYMRAVGAEVVDSVVRPALFGISQRNALLGPLGGATLNGSSPESLRRRLCHPGMTPIQLMTSVDFRMYMTDDILVKVDRASMLASLEVRAPFLDHRVIEFAFARVPDHLRATRHELKILPRRLAARLLPPTLDLQRKQGFSIPLDAWYRGQWGSFLDEILLDADPAIFDRAAIRRVMTEQRAGKARTPHIFAIAMFELWRREYGARAA